jgi:hypothetical protein
MIIEVKEEEEEEEELLLLLAYVSGMSLLGMKETSEQEQ